MVSKRPIPHFHLCVRSQDQHVFHVTNIIRQRVWLKITRLMRGHVQPLIPLNEGQLVLDWMLPKITLGVRGRVQL